MEYYNSLAETPSIFYYIDKWWDSLALITKVGWIVVVFLILFIWVKDERST
jgi:hypothetical protein